MRDVRITNVSSAMSPRTSALTPATRTGTPYQLPPEFYELPIEGGEKIHFYMLTPLYQEELDLKIEKSADELEERFEKQNIGFVLDLQRPNVALKRGWWKR